MSDVVLKSYTLGNTENGLRTKFITNRRFRACCAVRKFETVSQCSECDISADIIHRYRGFEEENGLEVGNAKRNYGQQDGSNQSDNEARGCWAYAAHLEREN